MSLLLKETNKLFLKNGYIYIMFSSILLNLLLSLNQSKLSENLIDVSSHFSAQMLEDESLYLWQNFLSSEGINIFLFVLSLSVAILLTVPEYRYSMNDLILVSKKGKKSLPYIKLLLGLLVCCFSCIVILSSQPVIMWLKYGLDKGSLSLQSLPTYAETTKNMTILEAMFLKTGFQIFGYCCLCLTTMMFIALTKGKVWTALTYVLGTLLLPLYLGDTLYNRQVLYKLPLPLSPILSFQYLSPSIIEYGTGLVMFRELNIYEIFLTNFAILILVLLCSIIFVRMFSERMLLKK